MINAFALMLFSMASTGTEAATIQGSVVVLQNGRSFDCVGVFLIPRSSESDVNVQQKFGRLDEGVQATPPSSLPQARYDPPQGTRRSYCRGRFLEKFKFTEVPPGEYYITMAALPRGNYEQEKFRPRTVEMMKRLSVTPGSRIVINFKHSD